jgi:hypothetical protein
MTIPHLDLQIEYLTAIKAGKRMEWRHNNGRGWSGWTDTEWLHHWLSVYEDYDYEIREVKRQQYIPECDVPRALEVEPEMGELVWSIAIGGAHPVVSHNYQPHFDPHKLMFINGFLWATESDARAAWDAMTARGER